MYHLSDGTRCDIGALIPTAFTLSEIVSAMPAKVTIPKLRPMSQPYLRRVNKMGAMSDLHLLSGRVLNGETVESVARDSTYDEEQIAWATAERLLARCSEELNKKV
jgi:hypothetical protein